MFDLVGKCLFKDGQEDIIFEPLIIFRQLFNLNASATE